ncbi:MAG: hypothetical protein ACYCW6_15360 [Candidatus Xenobia bacterium]
MASRRQSFFVNVGPEETIAERPFTAPVHTTEDLDGLRLMLTRLQETLAAHPELRRRHKPFRTQLLEDGDRPHQLVITRPHNLRVWPEKIAVGFFGHMRPGAEDITLPAVQQVDEELIGDFPRFGGLLSYSSLKLPNGDWGNMALFRDMEAMERWNNNRRHTTAIRMLAARHYDSIRLHVGQLDNWSLSLMRTKYYQFDAQGSMWLGICKRVSEDSPLLPPDAPASCPMSPP